MFATKQLLFRLHVPKVVPMVMSKYNKCLKILLVALTLGCSIAANTSINAAEGPTPVNLGEAGTFAILSQSGITNVYPSFISGDVGTSPITGAALLLTCDEVLGTIYTVDSAGPLPCAVNDATLLRLAVGDMGFAYDDAAGRLLPCLLYTSPSPRDS